MATHASGGVYLNYGTVDQMAYIASGGLQVNCGKASNDYCKSLPEELREKLQEKLAPLKNLTPEQLLTFNWKKFEKEVNEMVK